jgi:hypothetical protein
MSLRSILVGGLVVAGCMGAPGDGRGGGGDDDYDPDACSDLDQDHYGAGAGCLGTDCDDTDPGRYDGCGADCAADPTGFGCECETGSAPVTCFMGGDGSEAGVGVCTAGVRQCADGAWGECIGQVLPREEICNQLDDDCDGDTDEGVTNPDGTCNGGASGCEERARWIYVVTSDDQLVKFEPDSLRFTTIGRLDCPAPAGWKPFSMSVARSGDAYVLYRSFEDIEAAGILYRVSTTDASCEDVDYSPPASGWSSFGMGFSSDAEGSDAETMFVGGGDGSPGLGGSVALGRMNPPDLTIDSVGSLAGWPELTGTGSAELWGYFPQEDPKTVRQIDKSSGELLPGFNVNLGGMMTLAWAFAFWGGQFYLFNQDLMDPSTKVFALNPEGPTLEEVVSDTRMQIVGAGVSTCAPVDLI